MTTNIPVMMQPNFYIDRRRCQPARRESAQVEVHTIKGGNDFPPHYRLPRQITHFEILWIKRGAGTLLVNGCKSILSDHCIYVLSPGRLCLLTPEDWTEGYIISFPLEFLCYTDSQGNFSWLLHHYSDAIKFPTIPIEPEVLDEMEQLVVKMRREFEYRFLRGSNIMRGLLELFLIYFSSHFKPALHDFASRRDQGLVRKFLTVVKSNFKTMKMVGEYANELCVTPNYLNQVVKRSTGFPARHHIQQCIINHAKSQATYSDLSMKEIAYALGFEDYAHFSKYFKNISGVNFSHYRKLDGKMR